MKRMMLALLMLASVARADWVYVVQQLDETLGRADLIGTAETVEPLGALCNGITEGLNGYLYITNSSSLQEIDPRTNVTVRDLALPGCGGPWASVQLNADTMAISCSTGDRVAILRLSSGAVVDYIEVGNAPEGLLVHDERIFVTLTRLEWPDYGPGVVMVYDAHTLAFVDSIPVGMNPQAMAVDGSGRLHVVCTGNYGDVPGEIDVIELGTLTVTTVLPVGGTPADVAIGHQVAMVAAGGWVDHGYLYRYALDDLAILNDANNPLLVGAGATDVVATISGDFVVSCFMTDQVEVRTGNGELIRAIDVGDGPGNLLYGYVADAPERPGVQSAASMRMLDAYPNPFNATVTLRWDQPLRDGATIQIYNELGQMVGGLAAGVGATTAVWNPGMGPLTYGSSGVYFASWSGSAAGPPIRIVYLK